MAAFCCAGIVSLPKSVLLAVLCFIFAALGLWGFVYALSHGKDLTVLKIPLRRHALFSGAMTLVFLVILLCGQANPIVIAFGIVVFLLFVSDLAGILSGAD